MSDDATAPESLRVDKWLWHARFFKSRGIASRMVSDGQLRINGERQAKPGRIVRPGDVLTFVQQRAVRVVRIVALGERRGPAPEARALYEDLSPPEEAAAKHDTGEPRAGPRPDRRERRAAEQLKRGE